MNGKALAGFGVIVTRPEGQADALVCAIEDEGGHVVRFPVIDIVGRDRSEVLGEFARQPNPDIVVFISRNAVTYGKLILGELTASVAAVGPATAEALAAAGCAVDIVAEGGFDSEHLLKHVLMQEVKGKSVTIVRAESGRELLADTLRSRGAEVHYLPVYERRKHVPAERELLALESGLRDGSVHCLTAMSIESLQNFLQLAPATCDEYLRKTLLVAPGKRVIQTARDLIPGIAVAEAPGPQAADMVQTLIAMRQSGQNQ